MGFYLGKFIYILDAYDDLQKDKENNNYNALISLSEQDNFDEKCEEMLNFVLAECSKKYSRLRRVSRSKMRKYSAVSALLRIRRDMKVCA